MTRNRPRRPSNRYLLGVVLFVVVLGGMGVAGKLAHVAVAPTTPSPTVTVPAGTTGSATTPIPAGVAGAYQLVQEPQAGYSGLHAQTASAKKSIDMEMYELSDVREEAALAGAEERGVDVRVLLDSAFHGREVNQAAFDYLTEHRVPVRWAPSGVIFHIKTTTFDGAVTDVSTGNLTSKYYASTWDATVISRNPDQVAAIEGTFGHDWAGTDPAAGTVAAAGLVWSPSPVGTLVAEISSATHAVDFSSEELADRSVVDALAADARRGVTCEVLMTADASWDAAFHTITAAGCRVHVFPDTTSALYVHEKQILVDPGTSAAAGLIGSQNASVTSLTRNRELSLQLNAQDAPRVLSQLAGTFTTEYQAAPAWAPAN